METVDESAKTRFLETIRRVYADGDYGTERGQRTLDRKARVLGLDASQAQALTDELLSRFNEYKECLLDFLADGPLTDNQRAEAEEFRVDLDLTTEDVAAIEALVTEPGPAAGLDPEQATIGEPLVQPAARDAAEAQAGAPTVAPPLAPAETPTLPPTQAEVEHAIAPASSVTSGASSSRADGSADADFDFDTEPGASNNPEFTLITTSGRRNVEIPVPAENDWIYYDLMSEVLDVQAQFQAHYRQLGSLEAVVQNVDDLAIGAMHAFSDSILGVLRTLEVLDFSVSDILGEAYERAGDNFEACKDDVYEFLESITDDAAMRDAYRSARRQSRGKFMGLGGKGMMEAGAANMAIGAVHGVFNLLGKGITAASNASKKSSKFKQMEEPFGDAVFALCEGMYNVMAEIVSQEGLVCESGDEIALRQRKAQTILDNAVEADFSDDKMMDVAIRSMQTFSILNDAALFVLLTRSCDPARLPLPHTISNLRSLSHFAEHHMHVSHTDVTELDSLYESILEETVNSGWPKNRIQQALAEVDARFVWNRDRHSILKENFTYAHPDNGFIESSASVPGMLGRAFVDRAIATYDSLGERPFGDKFLRVGQPKFDDKLETAVATYATDMAATETPVFLYDDTLMGSAKSGFVITDQYIYSKGAPRLRLDEVTAISFSVTAGVHYIEWNSLPRQSLTMLSNEAQFQPFIRSLFPAVGGRAIGGAAGNEGSRSGAGPIIDITDAADPVTVDSFASEPVAPDKSVSTMRTVDQMTVDQMMEALRQLVAQTGAKSINSQVFVSGADKSFEKFSKAFGAYVSGASSEEVPLMLFDNTAFGSAKEGFLLTDRRLYGKNMMEKAWSLGFEEMGQVEADGSKLVFTSPGGLVTKCDIDLISRKERAEFAEFVGQALVVVMR